MDATEFAKELEIDRYSLDKECLSQSNLYFRYAELTAQAKEKVSLAENRVKLITGERQLGIRAEYAQKGIKGTEVIFSSEVDTDKAVQKVRNELVEATRDYNRLNAALNAINTRKDMLDNLVKLYVAGYFSVPANRDMAEAVSDTPTGNVTKRGRKKA